MEHGLQETLLMMIKETKEKDMKLKDEIKFYNSQGREASQGRGDQAKKRLNCARI